MKNLKQNLIALIIVISNLSIFAQGSMGALKGEVLTTDKQPLIGGTIKILQNGRLIGGTNTDEHGRYTYKPLIAGNYEILVSSLETQTKKVTNIRVSSETTTYVDVEVSTNDLDVVEVVAYVKPIIDKTFMDIKEISGIELTHMSSDRGDVLGAVLSISSQTSQGPDGDLHVRGSRGDATAMIVDGVKSPNITGVPALSIENLAVITGGIPAQYGDNTSGVIIVTTKDYFTSLQDRNIRHNYMLEREARLKREKEAMQNEKKRKKEIEEELRSEKEAKENKG